MGQEDKKRRPGLRTPSILARRAGPSCQSVMRCAILECVYWLGAALTASIRTHQSVLGLFDEEGLAILAQLHVQTHRLPIDLDVHLQKTFL